MNKNDFYKLLKMTFILLMFMLITTSSDALNFSDTSVFIYPEFEETVSMDFKDASLNDVLKIFSQQSNLNFIAAANVSDKKVNLYLNNVSIEEALERILSANNLTYEITPGSNIFTVKALNRPEKQLVTHVYRLKHASVSSAKITKEIGSSSDSDSSSSETSDSDSSEEGLISAIESLLTEDGSIVEDARTNSIIVTDIPSIFPSIEQTITKLDIRIPQILIEVEMLDISKSTTELLGSKWGNTPLSITGGERSDYLPFNLNNAMDTPASSGIEDRYTTGTVSFAGLTYILQFLRTQTDTKNLARPRILTLNNQTAEIKIVTDEAIGSVNSQTTSEGSSTSALEAERVQTGVFLKVTPQANIETGEITLAIEPRVIQARTGQTFGANTYKDPEERGTKSILRVKDGDTVILGGLLRNDISNTKTWVPFIGRIPIIGSLFKHKDKAETQRELIVFITPHIIQENVDFKAQKNNRKITREQDMPFRRFNMVDKELSSIERSNF
ncbi:MAG: secretin N-terminal domain-containing protein [Candidatus Zapsychrus exili]|nr:secretin N-terminal domain-containing protein [Candidatus Zapsychrus exili]